MIPISGLGVWVCRTELFYEIMMGFPFCLLGGARSARRGDLWVDGWQMSQEPSSLCQGKFAVLSGVPFH